MEFNSRQGCLECRTRRVRCDKTEPECFKCYKKGIKCSGQGIECRFSSHMKSSSPRPSQSASRAAGDGAKAPLRAPNRLRWVTVNSKQSGSSSDTARLASRRASTTQSKTLNKRPIIGPTLPHIPASDTDSSAESLEDDVEEVVSREVQLSRPQTAIQALSPQARQFFSYCKIMLLVLFSQARSIEIRKVADYSVFALQFQRPLHPKWSSLTLAATAIATYCFL